MTKRRSHSRQRQVVTYCNRAQNTTISAEAVTAMQSHEGVTRARMAEKLAGLIGFEFAGEYNRATLYDELYFVPSDTLLREDARQLGIRDEDHLFGGCVAQTFMGTKSITHPLFDDDAVAPPGWCDAFARAVAPVVLDGHAVFSCDDARRAARQLLRSDRIRFKPALGIGGCGQSVIAHIDELDAALAAVDADELARCGVVLEQHLDEVITYSVGCARLPGMQVAYYGRQTLTANHHGEKVYGGSSLQVVRGDLAALKQLDLPPDLLLAIDQARAYDAAADRHLGGFIASRRNYDIARGIDSRGRPRAGVLEQSWRIGGASPAEIAALEAFAAEPALQRVCASTCEIYSTGEPPPDAHVHFRGIDPRVGAIAKYTVIDAREYSTEQT